MRIRRIFLSGDIEAYEVDNKIFLSEDNAIEYAKEYEQNKRKEE